jgi:hypothetical protein
MVVMMMVMVMMVRMHMAVMMMRSFRALVTTQVRGTPVVSFDALGLFSRTTASSRGFLCSTRTAHLATVPVTVGLGGTASFTVVRMPHCCRAQARRCQDTISTVATIWTSRTDA